MTNSATDEIRSAYNRVGKLVCELDEQREINANLIQIMRAIVDEELDVSRLEFHDDRLIIRAVSVPEQP